MIRLKELREARHWNMKEAAKFLNKPYTTYVNHEKEYREPTSDDLVLYSRAYDVTIDYLLGRTDDPKGYGDVFDMNDHTLNDQEMEILQKYLDSAWDKSTIEIMAKYYQLNEEGQQKVKSYINDLVASGHYAQDTSFKVG